MQYYKNYPIYCAFITKLLLCFSITTTLLSCTNTDALNHVASNHVAQEIQVCFTPPKGCAVHIVSQINEATDTIYLQAYGFTSQNIADALINASKRGVKVHVMVDRTSIKGKGSKTHLLVENNIPLTVCKVSGIAHNKIIIIDGLTVITGSYNFTEAAEIRNAENVLIIKDPTLAQAYITNWKKLQAR